MCNSRHRTGHSTELDVLSKASLNDLLTDSRVFTECAQGPADGQDRVYFFYFAHLYLLLCLQ